MEGNLEDALLRLTGQVVKVHGSGRTDAGVHGLNQTASFSVVSEFSPEKWRIALNGVLPDDLVCLLYTSPSPRDWTISRMPSSA